MTNPRSPAHRLATLVLRWQLRGAEADALLGLDDGAAALMAAERLAVPADVRLILDELTALDRAMWRHLGHGHLCRAWLRHPLGQSQGRSRLELLIERGVRCAELEDAVVAEAHDRHRHAGP